MRKTIILPFPNPKLFPNRAKGQHWSFNSSCKKKAKSDAHYLTLKKLPKGTIPLESKVKLTMTFFCPDAIRRDIDNLNAALKSAIDGISLAIGIDDSKFLYGEPTKGIDRDRPRVEVKLEIIE